MPDWMSHLLIGLIFAELFNIRKKSLVLLGALMPDLIVKLFLLFFYLDFWYNFWYNISLDPFHTPIVCLLLTILIAPLFRYGRAKTIFLIIIGLITHFLSDLTMRHFKGGTRLFFPFSMNNHRLDLIWPEQSIYVLIFSLIVYIFIKAVKKIDFDKMRI